MKSKVEAAPQATQPVADESRRGFFVRMVALIGGLVLYLPVIGVGGWAFLSPLRRKSEGGKLLRVAALDAVPENGTPQRFPVIDERIDAWTHYPPQPIGAVFLSRKGDKVTAMQTICPHAGCEITFQADKKEFFCPCHVAHFELDGKRAPGTSPSPRDMDSLEVEVRGGDVLVKFEKFRTGTPQKTAES